MVYRVRARGSLGVEVVMERELGEKRSGNPVWGQGRHGHGDR